MKLAIAGLGAMGKPIAANLRRDGDDVVAIAKDGAAWAELDVQGIEATTDLAELSGADVIFLCLPDDRAVCDFLFGPTDVSNRLGQGQIVIDLGTTEHTATLAIGARLAERGVEFIDAPVSGMAARAAEGLLTVMCGGNRDIFKRVRPILERIGNNILYMGPLGSGQLVKLVNQLLFDINMAALAEVLPFAVKMGLDPALTEKVLNGGTGRSFASEFFVPRILRGEFHNGYPMQAAYKDLVSGIRLSSNVGAPMPVLAAAMTTYQSALLSGQGAKDKGAMIIAFEELLGVRFRQDDSMRGQS